MSHMDPAGIRRIVHKTPDSCPRALEIAQDVVSCQTFCRLGRGPRHAGKEGKLIVGDPIRHEEVARGGRRGLLRLVGPTGARQLDPPDRSRRVERPLDLTNAGTSSMTIQAW